MFTEDAKFRYKSVIDPAIAVLPEIKEFVARAIARCARFRKSTSVIHAAIWCTHVSIFLFTHLYFASMCVSYTWSLAC